jgi:hypothetical protein
LGILLADLSMCGPPARFDVLITEFTDFGLIRAHNVVRYTGCIYKINESKELKAYR